MADFKRVIALGVLFIFAFELSANEIGLFYSDGISVAEWQKADWASRHLRSMHRSPVRAEVASDVQLVDTSVSLLEKQMAVALAYAFCRYSLSDEALGIFPFVQAWT